MKLVLIVRNPIVRIVSDIVHEFLEGRLKEEEMPDIDSVIFNRGNNYKITSKTLKHHCCHHLIEISLEWVNKNLYPITNYTNIIEKILSVFPASQLFVLNGDNLIKFVFSY